MNQSPPRRIKHVGLDVHATSHAVAVAESGTEEVRYHGEIPGTPEAVDKILRKLGGEGVELRVCYEAGPTGYGLARHLLARGIACLSAGLKTVRIHRFEIRHPIPCFG